MDPMAERLNKLREERLAREKARIEKLRELNLKKYNKNDDQPKNSTSNLSVINKPTKSEVNIKTNRPITVKNNFHVNSAWKRPTSAPNTKPLMAPEVNASKPKMAVNTNRKTGKVASNIPKFNVSKIAYNDKKTTNAENKTVHHNAKIDPQNSVNGDKNQINCISTDDSSKADNDNKYSIHTENKTLHHDAKNDKKYPVNGENTATNCASTIDSSKAGSNHVNGEATDTEIKPAIITNHEKITQPKVILNKSANLRKSLAVPDRTTKPNPTRKSMYARPPSSAPKDLKDSKNSNQESVFERLYKPKLVQKTESNNVEKLHTDPSYLKKVIRSTGLILNKQHTVFDSKPKIAVPVRRSISAVHFKRISKQEIGNCIHKWTSIGDKLNNVHLTHINEDESVKEDRVVSAVKSERKKVKFLTPMSNFNSPRPEELQSRLKAWLQKHGKNLDSYHHLQCFGIHHLPQRINFERKLYDDENKENIAVESDSDDDSYTDNMNDEASMGTDKWRTASLVSESDDFNETQNTMMTCSDVVNTNDVLLGALNDLTELLREGFDWEQSARWLRAIRERFPEAPRSAAYWECRAALEERRGDLPASVQCWEEAIAKGTEHSVVEANLDQLLDKFMQLKISPNSGTRRRIDPKLVDVKNVFKSTIIRFAVQQAKLRQSNQPGTPKFTVTPVRRSGRLSGRTPLQARAPQGLRLAEGVPCGDALVFVPNDHLCQTP